MEIGILGAGHVGGSLGIGLSNAGHSIRFGVRDPDRPRAVLDRCEGDAKLVDLATAGAADVVFLTMPWAAVQATLTAAGDLSGTVLVDCTNAVAWRDGPVVADTPAGSAALTVAELAPGARVVKAFNDFGAELLLAPEVEGQVADALVAGDEPAAKQAVMGLAEDLGFRAVDAGPLRNAVLLEHRAVLWIHLAMKGGLGRSIAFKLLGVP